MMAITLSMPPLKLKVISDRFVDLCRFVAKKSELSKEDTDEIFNLEKADFHKLRPSSIKLYVREGRPVNVKENGPTIEVLGDNQVGKTTTLLYLANLLGYDFFNEDNIKFLGDENLVEQGQEIFSKLAEGMQASLEVSAKPYKLTIDADKGWIEFNVIKGSELVFFQTFELRAMSDAFMDSLGPYISIQFISKGRNFDRQLLMDISNEMGWYVEKFRERAENLMNILRGKADELVRKVAVTEGVDFNVRKQEIQSELQQLRYERQTKTGEITQAKLKIEATDRLLAQLPDLEEAEAFKLSRHIYQLKADMSRLSQRLEMFQKSREKKKEIDDRAAILNERLLALDEELDRKRNILESIEKEIENSVSAIESRLEDFLDESEAYRVLRVLRNHEFEILAKQRDLTEPDAGKAIEDLYKAAMKWNPSIRTTDALGGTIEALQNTFGSARKTILDRNLVKTITDSLYKRLKDNSISAYEEYEALESEIQRLKTGVAETKAALKQIEDMRKEVDKGEEDKRLLIKTKQEIESTKKKLQKLEQEMSEIDSKIEDMLIELERTATSLIPDDPKSLIYIPNWADKLLILRKELGEEIRQKEENLAVLKNQIEELERESQAITNILSDPGFEGFSKRRDCLDTFRGIMQTLRRVLIDRKCLTDRERVNDDLLSLSGHGIESELDKVINETFEAKCENYFRMINESEFDIETITDFDYVNRVFTCNDHKQNIGSLSGGTASVMTVLSLASKTAPTQFGMILLVDEFNDVAETLRNETFKRLRQKENLAFSFFARPLGKSPLKTRTVEMGA